MKWVHAEKSLKSINTVTFSPCAWVTLNRLSISFGLNAWGCTVCWSGLSVGYIFGGIWGNGMVFSGHKSVRGFELVQLVTLTTEFIG